MSPLFNHVESFTTKSPLAADAEYPPLLENHSPTRKAKSEDGDDVDEEELEEDESDEGENGGASTHSLLPGGWRVRAKFVPAVDKGSQYKDVEKLKQIDKEKAREEKEKAEKERLKQLQAEKERAKGENDGAQAEMETVPS